MQENLYNFETRRKLAVRVQGAIKDATAAADGTTTTAADGTTVENGTMEETSEDATAASPSTTAENRTTTVGMARSGNTTAGTAGFGSAAKDGVGAPEAKWSFSGTPAEATEGAGGVKVDPTPTLRPRKGGPEPEVISDVWAFKRRQELYPSFK